MIIWPSIFIFICWVLWNVFYWIHSYLASMNACTTEYQVIAKTDIKFLLLLKELSILEGGRLAQRSDCSAL